MKKLIRHLNELPRFQSTNSYKAFLALAETVSERERVQKKFYIFKIQIYSHTHTPTPSMYIVRLFLGENGLMQLSGGCVLWRLFSPEKPPRELIKLSTHYYPDYFHLLGTK